MCDWSRAAFAAFCRVMSIESYLMKSAHPLTRALYFNRWIHEIDDLKVKTAETFQELDWLEREIEGSAFTAVDCMMVPLVKSLQRASLKSGASNVGLLPFPLQTRWPRIAARLAEIEALEGYERTYPPHWR